MTDNRDECARSAQGIALRKPGCETGAPRGSDLADAIYRSVEAMRAVQTMFLSTILIVLVGFIGVSAVFGFSVSSGLRALNMRIDMDIQARASDRAAADARLDCFVGSAAHGTAMIGQAYALPALRRHY